MKEARMLLAVASGLVLAAAAPAVAIPYAQEQVIANSDAGAVITERAAKALPGERRAENFPLTAQDETRRNGWAGAAELGVIPSEPN
jgi:hypothetical protein